MVKKDDYIIGVDMAKRGGKTHFITTMSPASFEKAHGLITYPPELTESERLFGRALVSVMAIGYLAMWLFLLVWCWSIALAVALYLLMSCVVGAMGA